MTDFVPPAMPVTVSAAVRRDDKVLFVMGTYGDFKDVWTFPAGFVDAGEQPDAAAIRETHEEAGIVCELEGLISVVTLVWREAPMLYLVYLARHVSGEPTPDNAETKGAAFLGLADLDHMAGRRIDGQNLFVARRILSGAARVLLPVDSRPWHTMYRTSWL